MNFELTVERITSRFKEVGYGCMFTVNELQKWLGIINIDLDLLCHEKEEQETQIFYMDEVLETLNNQLIIEHSIYLEGDMDIQGFKDSIVNH